MIQKFPNQIYTQEKLESIKRYTEAFLNKKNGKQPKWVISGIFGPQEVGGGYEM